MQDTNTVNSVEAISTQQPVNSDRYQVVDDRTGDVMSVYQTRAKAMRKRDKLDDAHGSSRYSVKTVQSNQGGM